jgi:hypothetical protein
MNLYRPPDPPELGWRIIDDPGFHDREQVAFQSSSYLDPKYSAKFENNIS